MNIPPGDPHLDFKLTDQHSFAEESNYTAVQNKMRNLVSTLKPDENLVAMSGGIVFYPDGRFEFNRPVKEVLEILDKNKDALNKGIASLIRAVYEAGLAGREIPMKGGGNG